MSEKTTLMVTVQFVAQALHVSPWQVVHNDKKWGLTTHWSEGGGHRRYDFHEVKALAERWIAEAEELAEKRKVLGQ